MSNGYLQAFFLIYCIYFLLSAMQLKYGYMPTKIRNTLLQHKNPISGVCVKTIRAIPFLQELKVIMDWSFMDTTLDLFQWFKIEDIHFTLFCAKLDVMAHDKNKVGEKIGKIFKISMGWCLALILLLLIFGPMLLFSSLNPTSQLNPVDGGSLEMGILITNKTDTN